MSDFVDDRRELIAALLGPGEAELSCEKCFEQLDRYVDLQLTGAPADHAVPGMRAHLSGCPACREDHDALLEFVRAHSQTQRRRCRAGKNAAASDTNADAFVRDEGVT